MIDGGIVIFGISKAIAGKHKRNACLPGRLGIPLGISHIHRLFQAIAADDKLVVLPFGKAGGPKALNVLEILFQAHGAEKALDIPIFAVADDEQGELAAEGLQSLLHLRIELSAPLFQHLMLHLAAFFQQPLLLRFRTHGEHPPGDLVHGQTHIALKLRILQRPPQIGMGCNHLIPGRQNPLHCVPQSAVQIKKNAVCFHLVLLCLFPVFFLLHHTFFKGENQSPFLIPSCEKRPGAKGADRCTSPLPALPASPSAGPENAPSPAASMWPAGKKETAGEGPCPPDRLLPRQRPHPGTERPPAKDLPWEKGCGSRQHRPGRHKIHRKLHRRNRISPLPPHLRTQLFSRLSQILQKPKAASKKAHSQ